jgi:hypothetical protein
MGGAGASKEGGAKEQDKKAGGGGDGLMTNPDLNPSAPLGGSKEKNQKILNDKQKPTP